MDGRKGKSLVDRLAPYSEAPIWAELIDAGMQKDNYTRGILQVLERYKSEPYYQDAKEFAETWIFLRKTFE